MCAKPYSVSRIYARTRRYLGRGRAQGLVRLDALAILGALTLMSLIAIPMLASNRLRSDKVVCANNLRQISAAMQIWANDHNDRFPQDTPLSEGGTSQHPLGVNVWLHFSWISNELGSPVVLFCPSDQGRPARDFSGDPTGGYVHPNFANQATSYLLAHGREFRPTDVLSADRNVYMLNGSASCSRFTAAWVIQRSPLSRTFEWTSALHEGAGNLLLFDGRVVQVPNHGLWNYYSSIAPPDGQDMHFVSRR